MLGVNSDCSISEGSLMLSWSRSGVGMADLGVVPPAAVDLPPSNTEPLAGVIGPVSVARL